jgi:hypothetical protein
LDVAVFFGPVLTGSTTTMMAPVTLLAFRRQPRIPRWLGALGLITFVEQAVETITIFAGDQPPELTAKALTERIELPLLWSEQERSVGIS